MFEGPVQDLIDELGKLPGIGPKSAQRIAFHLLSVEPPNIDRLTAVLGRIRDGVTFCSVCGNVADEERCRICSDARRDASLICVVEEPKDIQAVERTREFRGRYHVLGGALDPLSGVGPDQLRIRELLNRIGERVDGIEVAEVIIATDPNTEGEATATYLLRMLRDIPGLTVSRIASGLPMGGDLEFADELTLGRALAGRRAMATGPARSSAPATQTAPNTFEWDENQERADLTSDERAQARATALRVRERATAAEPAVSAGLARVTGDLGGELRRFDTRLKGTNSLNRKIQEQMAEFDEDATVAAGGVRDSLRYTVVLGEDHYWARGTRFGDALEAAGFQRAKSTPGWNRVGHQGRNDTFRTADGFEFEVQFHTAASLAATEETHSLYGVMRLAATPMEEKAQLRIRQNAVFDRVPAPDDIRWID